MKPVMIMALVLSTVILAGCGGGGGGTSTPVSVAVGERYGSFVYMSPLPPAHTFSPWAGGVPGIRIDEVVPFTATVHPSGTGIYQGTTQVAFGRIGGTSEGKRVVVYCQTDKDYIQPLDGTKILIRSDGTWVAPTNPGRVSALLVSENYAAPDKCTSLPGVNGINVFAVVSQPP